MRLGTLRASLRSAKRPRTQFANSPKYKYKVPKVQVFQNTSFLQTSTYKNALQASEVLQPIFKASKGISRTSLHHGVLTRFAVKVFFPTICSMGESKEFIQTSYVWEQLFKCLLPRIPFFGSQVVVFTSNPSCVKYWLLCPFSTRKPCLKAVPETDSFTQQKQYHKRTTLRTWTSQLRERDAWAISPDYHASHPRRFCAVGDVVAQRYDFLCDWPWDACHMAGVRWKSCCKGFCSKEGPHYPHEQSARKLS